MIKKVVTLSYLSAAAPLQPPQPPRIIDMFEEGGRVWLCAACVWWWCVAELPLVSFVCFVRWRFIFLRLYDMELVLTLCVGARYYLNSKQDIWIQKSNDNLCGSARWIWIWGRGQRPTSIMFNKKFTRIYWWLLEYWWLLKFLIFTK